MPFCPMCGKQVETGSAFCGSCGAPQRKPGKPSRPEHRTPGAPRHGAAPLLKWLIPAVLLTAAIVTVIIVVVQGEVPFIGKSDEELIRERIAAFEDAYTSGDYDGMMECLDKQMQSVTEASLGLMDGLMSGMTGFDLGIGMSDMFGIVGIMGDFADFIIDDIQIEGDNAVVTLTMNMNMYGETASQQTALPMVKENGDWFIGGVTDTIGTDLFDSLSSFY